MSPKILKLLLNMYPPYWGTGIRVTHISPDFRDLRVEMPLRFYNRNYMGVHFGGSLFAMTDPFYMLMLMHILGPEYVVWDKSSEIEFVRPGKGVVKACFHVDSEFIADIREKTADGKKYLPSRIVEITDENDLVVAKVTKTVHIRKKENSRIT